MEKDDWHGSSWGGLRVRHGEATSEEPVEQPRGVTVAPRRAPKFDGEYEGAEPEDSDSDYVPDEDYDDDDEGNKGTIVGTALHGPKLGGSGGYEDMEMDDDWVRFKPVQHLLPRKILSFLILEPWT